MSISLESLALAAESTGFRPEILEKVFHLMDFLSDFFSHEILRDKIVLKGGTALNLFYFNFPRLSVDIDINYIGSHDREIMLQEREHIEVLIQEVISEKGFISQKKPTEHAGGKWRLRYKSASSGMGNLEIDLNYLCRVPLWSVVALDSFSIADRYAKNVKVLDRHEIAGSKLAALFSRQASRDLFDTYQILSSQTFDKETLRLAFMVFGAMSRRDWRTISIDDISFESRELQNMLIPLLRRDAFERQSGTKQLASQMLNESKALLNQLLPLRPHEKEFFDVLMENRKVDAGLICSDPIVKSNIELQPGLQWKIKNLH